MKKRFSLLGAITSLLLLVIIVSACKKDPDAIGLDVQPSADQLNVLFSDSLGLLAWSELEDSIPTSNVSTFLLGSLSDPIYGKTYASIYSQILLSKNDVTFGTNPVVDSFILVLPYKGYYGDTNYAQKAFVYELNESISRDSIYYSKNKVAYINTTLTQNPAGYSFYPQPTTRLTINESSVTPQLRIPLSNDYATQKLSSKSGATELSDNTNFIAYMKGLCIITAAISSIVGNLMYFDFSDGSSKAILYYHNSTDTSSFEFSIRRDSACFIGYSHNYKFSNNLFKQEVLNKDTAIGSQILFLQPGGGVRTVIKFPNLKNYIPKSDEGKPVKIIVNEAELVITGWETDPGIFTAPDKLALARLGSDSSLYFLPDNANPLGDDVAFGGYYDATKKEYRFRIKAHLQQIFDGITQDYGLYLRVSGSSVKGNRYVINGSSKTLPNRLRLRLSYTIIK